MGMILSDVRAVAEGIFLGGSWALLAMAVVSIIAGLAAMRSFGQLFCVSLLGLIVFAAVWIIYGGATSAAPFDLSTWTAQLDAGWANISATSGATLVGCLLVFAVAIAILYVGKALLIRR